MAVKLLLPFLLAATLLSGAAVDAHNISTILEAFPEYSVYNGYLSQTKVADEINSRETVTVLVLTNDAALRLLTVLDYYDAKKLHDLSEGSVLTTTLLQTTGAAPGNLGFINITDLAGKVAMGSTSPGSKLDSHYTRSVKQIPTVSPCWKSAPPSSSQGSSKLLPGQPT
ncbi:unnamed protein product [Spirodela intermedia]|uniref:Uncharacterized protein n=2 Tax=Spirodela intermedia TaxID=51605 RepID=A0A7I8KPU9_SPIIN|nr:unnamed protein product [Spirodela intermedia]CAA6663387.1 unnamed protein product [Spirodela intermedia]CAA7399849.1 unnamed protein product [Spirodela intermedia]